MLLENKRILVVEDNLQNRIVFQMSLIRHGASVHFERWGRHTLHQLGNMSHVDLIIMDLMLADGVSGLSVFDEVRALPKYANVPIVAVSAKDPALAMPQVKAKGFSGFIAKPIDNDLFPKQIARIIEGETVWYAGERSLI